MEFVTRNPLMQELQEQSRKFAMAEHPILIQGESGTGKEKLARYIHQHSGRARGPFVQVECATIPDELWEQELFGNSQEGRVGKFALAEGGTIFFTEIAAVPLSVQGKLLRVAQERTIAQTGAAQEGASGTRIMAATARDLSSLKDVSLFREDLYYFLKVLLLAIPPLRERKEDLESIAHEILVEQTERGLTPPRLSAEAIGAILLYSWPGNIRELENAFRRALLLAGPHGPIDLRHLPPEVSESIQPAPPRPVFKRYIRAAELLFIRWALSACGNDRTKAAKFLGLSRAALYKKLKLYPEFKIGQSEGV